MLPLFRRPPKRTIAALYGAIVAQARACRSSTRPTAVPDTVLGRFDMIVLHLVLLLRRLRDGRARRIARWRRACSTRSAATWTTICARWASAIRACRDQMRRVGEAFYGRAQAYEAALARAGRRGAGGGARPQCLCGGAEPPVAAVPLAAYVRQRGAASGRQDARAPGGGDVRFPPAPQAAAAAE